MRVDHTAHGWVIWILSAIWHCVAIVSCSSKKQPKPVVVHSTRLLACLRLYVKCARHTILLNGSFSTISHGNFRSKDSQITKFNRFIFAVFCCLSFTILEIKLQKKRKACASLRGDMFSKFINKNTHSVFRADSNNHQMINFWHEPTVKCCCWLYYCGKFLSLPGILVVMRL